jgi:hypothetical protein
LKTSSRGLAVPAGFGDCRAARRCARGAALIIWVAGLLDSTTGRRRSLPLTTGGLIGVSQLRLEDPVLLAQVHNRFQIARVAANPEETRPPAAPESRVYVNRRLNIRTLGGRLRPSLRASLGAWSAVHSTATVRAWPEPKPLVVDLPLRLGSSLCRLAAAASSSLTRRESPSRMRRELQRQLAFTLCRTSADPVQRVTGRLPRSS